MERKGGLLRRTILEFDCILTGMSQHRERDWQGTGDTPGQGTREHRMLSPNRGISHDGEGPRLDTNPGRERVDSPRGTGSDLPSCSAVVPLTAHLTEAARSEPAS